MVPPSAHDVHVAMINAHVRAVAPRLPWHDQVAGWDLLAFEYVDGACHADYRPGSPDLPRVIETLHRLAAIGCPDLTVKQARQRGPPTSTVSPTWTCSTAVRSCTPTSIP
jgi:hypothetical protein